MNHYTHHSSLLLILVALCAGCSGNAYPAVSGKVTHNGQPVPSITVVFTPVGSTSTPTPGPYSIGITDEQGNFTLQTRRGDRGAVPGPHRIGILCELDEKLTELKFELREADDGSKPAIQQRIDELKILLKSRVEIPANGIYKFTVPKDGTASANFELNQE